MGYHEIPCVLCGVSFCIGRIRSADEPRSHAWNALGWPGDLTFAEGADDSREPKCGSATGCLFAVRDSRDTRWERSFSFKKGEAVDDERDLYPDYDENQDSTYEYESEEDDEPLEYDSDVSDSEVCDIGENETSEVTIRKVIPTEVLQGSRKPDIFQPVHGQSDPGVRMVTSKQRKEPHFSYDGFEHIAGPGCADTQGYHASAITYEEMKHCTAVQCLVNKDRNWTPEPDDQDFELSSNCFLSGLAPSMPSTDMGVPTPIMPRHGAEEIEINYYAFGPGEKAMPFHPTCFEIFQRASKLAFGQVDVQGLMHSYNVEFDRPRWGYEVSYDDAVYRGLDQMWLHNEGDEFLAANPVFIPVLERILRSSVHEEPSFSPHGGAFLIPETAADGSSISSSDPFMKMPQEIRDNIVEYLTSREIAQLRLSSRAFGQLRISLWYNLLSEEMPWLWEIWSDDVPTFWSWASVNDLMAEKYLKPKLDEELRSYRSVISDEMPEIYEEWCAAQPAFDEWAVTSKSQYDSLTWFKVPRSQTNWYEVYRGITVHWKDLKGLQNRRRIWKGIQEILGLIKGYRAEGQVV